MDEIAIDRRQVAAPRQRVEQVLAHLHELAGGAGRQIDAANEFLPPRLGGFQHLVGGLVGGLAAIGGAGARKPRAIGTEALGERLEEGDPLAGPELGIVGKNFARERYPRGLAPAREKRLA